VTQDDPAPQPEATNGAPEPTTERAPASEAEATNGAPVTSGAAFDEFMSWVPPWARSLPELIVEPASDYTPEELNRYMLDSPRTVPDQSDVDEDGLPDPDAFEPGLGEAELRGALEAILLVVDEPVTTVTLAQVLQEPPARLTETLRALAGEYATTGRGFDLREVAGGWRLYTRGEFADYVERFVLDGQQVRLTQAALETLAVVAYKQPVTRSRIAAIRGVNSDGVIKTLLNRGLVEECGTEPESGAHLYRTSRLFLEKVGLNSVEELPSLGPFLPDNIDEIDFAQR
jgi:segregation and condensation protein B